jgi:hypothetical protein
VLLGILRFWIYEQGWSQFNAHEEMRSCLRVFRDTNSEFEISKMWMLRMALGMGQEGEMTTPSFHKLNNAVKTSWAWVTMGVVID